MDVENPRHEECSPKAPRDEGVRRELASTDASTGEAGLEEALLRRIDRIVALARRGDEPAPHGELLDELRGLVREAERLSSPPTETRKEVVERPAQRLHGT